MDADWSEPFAHIADLLSQHTNNQSALLSSGVDSSVLPAVVPDPNQLLDANVLVQNVSIYLNLSGWGLV